MCGIYGYIGRNSINEVMGGLKRLEYRGYDSAGIAFIGDNLDCEYADNNEHIKRFKNLTVIKSEGQMSCLEEVINKCLPIGDIAIGHTRWATHGKPSVANAHPHISKNGKWVIVHNGIIENFEELKKQFSPKRFVSDTDSEVVAHLLEKYYDGSALSTLNKVCRMIKGSFALAVLTTYEKDKIFVAKYGSPVVVGCDEEAGVVCSDLNSIKVGKCAFILEDNQFAVVEKGNVSVYDENLKPKKLKNMADCHREERGNLGNYSHFMLKEIDEIPRAITRTIEQYNSYEKMRTVLPLNVVRKIKKILIIGCGTAYHAGLIGKRLFEEIGIKSEVEIASEFRYNTFIPEKNTIAIFVSQSGETADTIKALSKCKENNLLTLAMTNVKNSSICFVADRVIYTSAGAEIGVASTKAYNSQVALFYLISSYFKSVLDDNAKDFDREVVKLLDVAKVISHNKIKPICQKVADEIYQSKSIYMIGRGLDYDLAREASLKLKEISYIHCEAYPAGELKHGTISLIDDKTFVFSFITQKMVKDKTQSSEKEISARGGKIIKLTQFEENNAFMQLSLPEVEEKYMPLIAVVYMQLISYYTSVRLGNNPDKPRSLAKSVTVE